MDMDNQDPEVPESDAAVTKQEPPTFAAILHNATDRVLVFLSHASNETLGACLVGLGAATYLVLGRIGLVLIGVVGGVSLHATWETGDTGDKDAAVGGVESKKTRATGLDIMQRVLDWREKTVTSDLIEDDDLHLEGTDYSVFRPETAAALSSLTDAVVTDYVKWWYSPILADEVAFPAACRQTLSDFIVNFATRLSRKRPADAFLDFVTNASSIFIVYLNELSAAMSASPNSTVKDALNTYLRSKPQCNLATLMDDKTQRRKLQMVADDILERNLEINTYRCDPARIFLRKMFSGVVLEMTLKNCSRPEWINEWIVYLLEDGEPEILNVIDEGVQKAGPLEAIVAPKDPTLIDEEVSEASKTKANHKRTVSRAEEAMDEAMQEAKRLTQMIIDEEARKAKEHQSLSANASDDLIESNTQEIATPTSSQSDQHADHDGTTSTVKVIEPTIFAHEDATIEQPATKPAFTSFDQLGPIQAPTEPTALRDNSEDSQRRPADLFTLHRAKIVVLDDANPNDKRPIKTKPMTDFLIQIEPASSHFPGWMIQRLYTDFETVHEVLRRISNISGAGFTDAHANLPPWKGVTKSRLRDELERYLTDAILLEPLADSEGMKRFLDRDQGLARTNSAKGNFTAFENVGKGVLDVLSKAPKGVAGGGKAVIGGVSSVLGGVTNSAVRKAPTNSFDVQRAGRGSASAAPGETYANPSLAKTRQSEDTSRKSFQLPVNQNGATAAFESRQASSTSLSTQGDSALGITPSKLSLDTPQSHNATESPTTLSRTPSATNLELTLPPRPSDMPDDYQTSADSPVRKKIAPQTVSHMSGDGTAIFDFPSPSTTNSPFKSPAPSAPKSKPRSQQRPKKAMTEQEAQVTVELLFAVINELYTLSSAWQIRKTLLTAARSFLLRPRNPQLESIRVLIEETIIEANTCDAGVAAHIRKMRENALPTEEELKAWPALPTEDEKSTLRKKARKLLVERGMPQALSSVMGAAAGGEALGKVFDSLQNEDVARGLMFGLLLQGARTIME